MVATQADLQERYEAALADALRDPLTGLGNHRAFHEELERQVAASLRYNVPLALFLIDLDEFKASTMAAATPAAIGCCVGFGGLLAARSGWRIAHSAWVATSSPCSCRTPISAGAQVVARRLLAQSLQPCCASRTSERFRSPAGISAMPELGWGPHSSIAGRRRDVRGEARRTDRGRDLRSDHGARAERHRAPSSSAIAEVIAHGQLRAVYQPIVSLDTRRRHRLRRPDSPGAAGPVRQSGGPARGRRGDGGSRPWTWPASRRSSRALERCRTTRS